MFGFLPLANWVPGGHAAQWFGVVAVDWLTGAGVAVGAGAVAAILLGHRFPRALSGPDDPRRWALWVLGLCLGAAVLYGVTARAVFSGRPLLIDEIIQVFQARILAAGKLWIPAEPHQFFFSSMHLVEQGGRVYGHFPMGGPAMLALGSLVGAEWLVNPVFGGLSVLLFGALARRLEPRAGPALLAVALFGLAPFAVFLAGSHMNHVPTGFWLLVGMIGLSRSVSGPGRVRDGILCGLGFGIAATIRPADAIAFALPAGIWLLVRALRGRGRGALLGAGLGLAVPLLALLWVNRETTGSPLQFGYTVLWGRVHDIGFHAAPWGPPHTPARGLELINIYFLRLQSYLFEAALPSLLPAAAALALTRRLSSFDRYLLASGALLVGLYFAYWHDGYYLGPRFLYPLLPVLVLWTARLPSLLRDRLVGAALPDHAPGVSGSGSPKSRIGLLAYRTSVASLVIAVGLGLGTALPLRAGQYRGGLLTLRWDADRAAEWARVSNALVLVRESWGAEMVARMWALGISRPDAEALYRAADPCRLELSLGAIEEADIRGDGAARALDPLRGDSANLVRADSLTGDPSLRVTPGVQYPPVCLAKLAANRSGFTLFPPLLLARRHGNLYARDLGARDSLLLRDYPGRPVYLLKPESGAVGAEPVFRRLAPDSLLRAWRGSE